LAVTLSPLSNRNTNDVPQNPLCEFMTSSTKPEIHKVYVAYHNAGRGGRAMALSNMHRRIGEVRPCS